MGEQQEKPSLRFDIYAATFTVINPASLNMAAPLPGVGLKGRKK